MYCYVYKGDNKADYYLYLDHKLSAVTPPSDLPESLWRMLGELLLVLELDLIEDKILAQADASQVISDIQSQGFYLQMPKKDWSALEDQYFN